MSVDKQELRRLAEAMPALDWDSNFESNEQTGFCCVYAKPFEIDGEMYDGQTFVEICHPEQAKFIAEAKENILSLLDELEQYRKDALRYRWLRGRLPGSSYRIAGVIYSEGGEGVDEAIDAAMAKEQSQ